MVDIIGANLKSFKSYIAEEPTDQGYFIDDDPTTQINRFRDRTFFGDGVEYTGRRTAPYGGSWLIEKGASYFEKNATVTILTPETEGRYGLVVGSYEGNSTASGHGAIFGISVSEKDGSQSGRAGYFESFLKGNASSTGCVEIQVGNYTNVDPNPTSYGNSAGVYGLQICVEAGAGYTVGDANTPVTPPTYPAASAVTIGGGSLNASYQKWKRGIVFLHNGLYRGVDGLTGNATAIQMAQNHQIEWKASASLPGAMMRSDVTSVAGNDVSVIFSNKNIKLAGTSETTIMDAVHIANGVNFLEVGNAVTNSYPHIMGTGSDTNVGLFIGSKGTGQIRFSSHGAASNINLAITTTASAPVNYLTAGGGATGNPARVGASGTDANVSIYITPKGTTGETRLLGGSGSASQVRVNDTGIGFFGTAPAAKPTGVPVTAADIHAALVTLGLIAA